MRYALLAAAILFLSQPANLVRWADAPAETIGFWRLALAAAALAPLAYRRRASWSALGSADRRLLAAAGLLFFGHLWTYIQAATHTSIANCMLVFAVHPLLTALGARLFFGDPLTPRLGAALGLALLGIAALLHGSVRLDSAGLAGDAAALVSAALFSAYVLCGRRLRRGLDNAVYAGSVYGATAACFLAVGLARGVAWTGYPAQTWLAIAGLAFGVTLCGHAVFTYLLGIMDVNQLSVAKLLEPAAGAAVAAAAFGEPITLRTVGSFAAIAAALVVLAAPSRRAAEAEAEPAG